MKTLPKTYMERLKKGVPLDVEDYWAHKTLGRNHTPASCSASINSRLLLGFTERQWEMWEDQLKQAVRELVDEYYTQHKPEYPEAQHKKEFCPLFVAWQDYLRTEYGLSDESVTTLDRMVRHSMWKGETFESATLSLERVIKIARKDL